MGMTHCDDCIRRAVCDEEGINDEAMTYCKIKEDVQMGMTIEDYIKIIQHWLYKGTNGLTNTKLGHMEGWFHKTDKEAFETAIDIMRKYQTIELIRDRVKYTDLEPAKAYELINEVLEDGKVD